MTKGVTMYTAHPLEKDTASVTEHWQNLARSYYEQCQGGYEARATIPLNLIISLLLVNVKCEMHARITAPNQSSQARVGLPFPATWSTIESTPSLMAGRSIGRTICISGCSRMFEEI